MMVDITSRAKQVELAVDEAVDNESVECTSVEREQFIHHKRAYINAASYADAFGISIDEFRQHLCKTRAVDPKSL